MSADKPKKLIAEKKSPCEWAQALGFVVRSRKQRMVTESSLSGTCPDYDSVHEAAAALHGWAATRYHSGEDMLLSEADYRAARKAVEDGPVLCEDGLHHYQPHGGAIGAHYPHKMPPARKEK